MNPAKAVQLFIFMQPAMIIHFLPLSLKGTAPPLENVHHRERKTLAFFQPIRASVYNFFQPIRASNKKISENNQSGSACQISFFPSHDGLFFLPLRSFFIYS